MQDVIFTNLNYSEVSLPEHALVYCDIPYRSSTKKYQAGWFDHESFYRWSIEKAKEGKKILVSEYKENVPEGWEIVWEKKSRKNLKDKNKTRQETIEVVITPLI